MIQLGEHFRHDDRSRHSEWLQQRQWFIKARNDQTRQEKIADRLEDNILPLAIEVAMATSIQIEQFRAKLDSYNDATTAALMEHEVTLEDIERRLAELDKSLESFLLQGNVMDDGKRVFLNAARTQAYDEFGEKVSSEEYDYGLFPEDHIPVDSRLKHLEERGQLFQSRDKTNEAIKRIHKFDDLRNQKLDELDKGNVTEERLTEMDVQPQFHVPFLCRVSGTGGRMFKA